MRLLVGIFGLLVSLAACAEKTTESVKETYEAGKHYQVLSTPVKTVDPNKIEVAEVFWYGCGHCFHFEPAIQKWKKTLADDVVFVPVPAMWRKNPMEAHAKVLYTAKALGVLDKIHEPFFKALNVERKRLGSEKELADWFAGYGIDKDKFSKAFNSFGVVSQVNQANAKVRGYKIQGTPEIIVNGTYRISGRMAGSQEDMLKVAEFLIDKIRAKRAKS